MIPLWAIKAGIIAIIVTLVTGGYFFWKHKVASEALDSCNAEWTVRDNDTRLQSVRIKAEADTRVKIETEKIENAYQNAISVYAGYAERVRNAQKTTTASRSTNRVPAASSCPEDTARSSEETLSIKAVELIIEKICLPGAVVR